MGYHMKIPETCSDLEKHKKELLAKHLPPDVFRQIEAIDLVIASFKLINPPLNPLKIKQEKEGARDRNGEKSSKIESIIDAVLQYINMVDHKVTTTQLVDYFREKELFVNEWKDPATKLGSFLSTENHKKSGRIKSVGRATWYKR